MRIYLPEWKWYLDGRNCKGNYKRLKIQLKYAKKREYLSFNLRMTEEQWDIINAKRAGKTISKAMLDKANITPEKINEYLGVIDAAERRIKEVLRNIQEEKEIYTIGDIKKIFDSYIPITDKTLSVKYLFDDYVSTLEKPKTREIYKLACRSFCRFYEECYGGDIEKFQISDIDEDFLKKYTAKNPQSSSETYKRHLRAIYNYAKKKNLISDKVNPFKGNIKRVQSKNIALNNEQLKTLFRAEGLTKKEQMGVDFLVLSVLLNGANFVDIAQLKWGDVQILRNGGCDVVFKRQKTRDKVGCNIKVELRNEMFKKWENYIQRYSVGDRGKNDYIFHFLHGINETTAISKRVESEKRLLLKALSGVSSKLGLPNLNFQVIRHTFATHLYYSTHHDIYEISKALGHSDIKTTQNYLDSIVLEGEEQPITKAKLNLLADFLL